MGRRVAIGVVAAWLAAGTAAAAPSLVKLLADYQQETHHEIAVLIVPDLHDEPIGALSLRVANAWRVGLPGWNDGVLVTFAVREGICRIEIATEMARYVSNDAVRSIVENTMKPEFGQHRITRGLRMGLLRLMELGRGFRIADPAHPPG